MTARCECAHCWNQPRPTKHDRMMAKFKPVPVGCLVPERRDVRQELQDWRDDQDQLARDFQRIGKRVVGEL